MAGSALASLMGASSFGARPELVVNGGFSAGATGWSAFNVNSQAPLVEAGELVVSNAANGIATAIGASQSISLVVGRSYVVSGLVRRVVGDYSHITILNAAGSAFVAQGVQVTSTTLQPVSFIFTATEITAQVYLRAFRSIGTATAGQIAGAFDNISVR